MKMMKIFIMGLLGLLISIKTSWADYLNIFFEDNRAILTAQAKGSITAIIPEIRTSSEVWIDGYASPPEAGLEWGRSNQRLSEARAQSVADFIRQRLGAISAKFQVQGHGVYGGNILYPRQRRVEIRIITPEKKQEPKLESEPKKVKLQSESQPEPEPVQKWEIGGNIPYYGYIAKDLLESPFRIDVAVGEHYGGALTYYPDQRWGISAVGILDDFRGEKVGIGDLQINYRFYRNDRFSGSIGLDRGYIFPFESQDKNGKITRVEGDRLFVDMNFAVILKKSWTVGLNYYSEWTWIRNKKNTESGADKNKIGVILSYSWPCASQSPKPTFKELNRKPVERLLEVYPPAVITK